MVYSISPVPKWDAPDPATMMQHIMEMPFSPLQEIANSGAATFPTLYGLGTAFRGAVTPAGNEPPPLPTGNPIADVLNAPAQIRAGIEGIGRLITGQANPPMDKAAYEASPYYRKAVPWDEGMTEDRAAALADEYDVQQARAMMSDKYGWDGPFGWRMPGLPTFIGSVAVQALDPVNYVPVLGEAGAAAAVGRFGLRGLARVGVRSAGGAFDAAANTALFGALTAEQRAKYGDDVSWQATLVDMGIAALIGGIVSPLAHGIGDRASAATQEKVRVDLEASVATVPHAAASRDVLNDAVVSLVRDGEVRLTPASGAVLSKVSADVAARRDAVVAQQLASEQHGAAAATRREEIAQSVQTAEPGQTVTVYDPAGKEVPVQIVSRDPESGATIVRDQTGATHQLDRGEYSTSDPNSPAHQLATVESAPAVSDLADAQIVQHAAAVQQMAEDRLKAGDAAGAAVAARDLNALAAEAQRRQEGTLAAQLASTPKAALHEPATEPATDMTPPRADPPPQGLAEAQARIGREEDTKGLAAQHSVEPDGSFPEEKIIEMMREQDVLTAEDKAELEQADQTLANARAWGEALVTAARCAFGAL